MAQYLILGNKWYDLELGLGLLHVLAYEKDPRLVPENIRALNPMVADYRRTTVLRNPPNSTAVNAPSHGIGVVLARQHSKCPEAQKLLDMWLIPWLVLIEGTDCT